MKFHCKRTGYQEEQNDCEDCIGVKECQKSGYWVQIHGEPNKDNLPLSHKENYELWWEYLKLSDKYRTYCDLKRENKEIPKKFKPKNVGLLGPYIDDTDYNFELKFGEIPGEIWETYLKFGDVHTDSFEDFWEGNGKLLYKTRPAVSFLSETLKHDLFLYEKFFREKHKRAPTYKEFKEFLWNCLFKLPMDKYLHIDMLQPVEAIKKDFNRLLSKEEMDKVRHVGKKTAYLRCRNCSPTPNLKPKQAKRYLNVLKAFKAGLKREEAFNYAYPGGGVSKRTYFKSDKDKAERIVQNVEIGYFPGVYGKEKKKKNKPK